MAATATASQLREGMVVVKDVTNAGGAMRLPAGTHLNSTTVARLAQHLDGRSVIEVAEVT